MIPKNDSSSKENRYNNGEILADWMIACLLGVNVSIFRDEEANIFELIKTLVALTVVIDNDRMQIFIIVPQW